LPVLWLMPSVCPPPVRFTHVASVMPVFPVKSTAAVVAPLAPPFTDNARRVPASHVGVASGVGVIVGVFVGVLVGVIVGVGVAVCAVAVVANRHTSATVHASVRHARG